MFAKHIPAAVILSLGLASAQAATTVNFNVLNLSVPPVAGTPGTAGTGLVYIEGGLTFTTDAPNLLQYWGPTDVENADPTGAALYSSEIDPPLVVTLTAGGTFDLISFQLAEADNSPIAFAATFRYTDGSGIHSSILNHAAASGLQTYVLNLNGITSFELTDIDFQIDNITYNVTPVPELSTYALLSLGLAAISARIRRRR